MPFYIAALVSMMMSHMMAVFRREQIFQVLSLSLTFSKHGIFHTPEKSDNVHALHFEEENTCTETHTHIDRSTDGYPCFIRHSVLSLSSREVGKINEDERQTYTHSSLVSVQTQR